MAASTRKHKPGTAESLNGDGASAAGRLTFLARITAVGGGPRQPQIDLIDFLNNELYPALAAEVIYTDKVHNFRKSGDTWRGDCPWHDSKSGSSFWVTESSLLWYCAGCHFGGSPVEYLHRLAGGNGSPRGEDFIRILKDLANLAGVWFPERELTEEEKEDARRRGARQALLGDLVAYCESALWSPVGEEARAFLGSRGLTEEAIKDLRLGFYDDSAKVRQFLVERGHHADDIESSAVLWAKLQGYIVFPWSDDAGRPLTIYGRWPAKTPPDGTPKTIALPNPKEGNVVWDRTKRSCFLLDRVLRAGHKDVVLVEGIIDAAVAHAKGDDRVVACVAAELSEGQVQTLVRRGIISVTIALDPDVAGDNGIDSCVRQLLETGKITPYVAPKLPDGMDPDEFLLGKGVEAWRSHIGRAVHAFRYKAQSIIAAHRPADGWTDRAEDTAVKEAIAFAASQTPERDEELDRHFWSVITEETGADRETLRARIRTERPEANSQSKTVSSSEWPDPPDPAAFHGLAGELLEIVGPHTEADPVALIAQLLVAFGSCVGRSPYFAAEGDRHYLNEYVVLMGRTSKGRKGVSWGRVKQVLETADPVWVGNNVVTGLSTGEGLIHVVRDPVVKKNKEAKDVTEDPGVKDKRLLCYEAEFASVLKRGDQVGNTLTAVLRVAFDSGDLRTLTKNNPVRATGAHISLVGHCTTEELKRYLSATEQANGFGNRVIWLCVRRSKCLPEGGCLDPSALEPIRDRLQQAVALGRAVTRMQRDEPARLAWHDVYEALSEGHPGMAGALLGRSEVHVMRLACLYALLDQSYIVRLPHLRAALALWEYSERSVRFVFGHSLGDPVADELLKLLIGAGKRGVSRTEMRDFFSRNRSADRIGGGLALLLERGLARSETIKPGGRGRPEERWFAKGF